MAFFSILKRRFSGGKSGSDTKEEKTVPHLYGYDQRDCAFLLCPGTGCIRTGRGEPEPGGIPAYGACSIGGNIFNYPILFQQVCEAES
jgi:hypothetical protein